MKTYKLPITFLALSAMIVQRNCGQTGNSTSGTPFPHPVALDISFERSTFEVRAPIIAKVTLTNLSDQPFHVALRHDGSPLHLSLEVAERNEPYRIHALWLQRGAPEPKEKDSELGPGESASGDILVLLDYGKGYVFPKEGRYTVRWRWSPGREFSKIYSDELHLTIIAPS